MAIRELLRTPETYSQARLVAMDFDNTVARTFEPSPNGLGVTQVCSMSIQEMFGSRVFKSFEDSGGLQNRAPAEVIRQLAPDAEGIEHDRLVDEFISKKLEIIMGEIGKSLPDGALWPRPTAGYLELCKAIQGARARGSLIDEAIISSGHEPFIQEVYSVWGIQQPGIVIATETTQRAAQDLELSSESLVKPASILIQMARTAWALDYDVMTNPAAGLSSDEQRRITYVGDDLNKDAGLAKNSGVAFEHINPNDPTSSWATWQRLADKFALGKLGMESGGLDA